MTIISVTITCMASTELDCAARGEMSGKYLTRTQTHSSSTEKATPPTSAASPSSATSAGTLRMLWLAGNRSFSLFFFVVARLSTAAVTARLTTSSTAACSWVLSWVSS